MSNGNVPSKIAHHVTKVYLKVKAWQIDQRNAKIDRGSQDSFPPWAGKSNTK